MINAIVSFSKYAGKLSTSYLADNFVSELGRVRITRADLKSLSIDNSFDSSSSFGMILSLHLFFFIVSIDTRDAGISVSGRILLM